MIIGTITAYERQMLFLLYVNDDMSIDTSTEILMAKCDTLLMYDTEARMLTPEAGAYLPIMEFLATDEGLIALAKSLILREERTLSKEAVRKGLKKAAISAYMVRGILEGKSSRKTAIAVCNYYGYNFHFKTTAVQI
jgi:hypothetical protein